MESKICNKCNENLSIDNFYKKQNGFVPRCKNCHRLSRKIKPVSKDAIINFIEIEGEEWKKIIGFDYEVSNMGRVRSVYREFEAVGIKRKVRKVYPSMLLKQVRNEDGYSKVSMSVVTETGSRKQKLFSVHRLVCEAFIPNPDNKPQINHIDRVRGTYI